MSLPRIIAKAATAVALALPGMALAAIVVSASGPSAGQFPAGRKLDDSQTITLRPGDAVTVLDARGTRVLRGNGAVPVAASGTATRAPTFAALVQPRDSRRVRTGAVRTGSGAIASPNLWYVDIDKPGVHCVVEAAAVKLWRADTTRSGTLRIAAKGPVLSTLTFPAGTMIANWDTARAPVRDGVSYTLTSDTGLSKQVSFAVLPSAPATPEDAAAALIEHGCTAQLDLLSSTLALPAG